MIFHATNRLKGIINFASLLQWQHTLQTNFEILKPECLNGCCIGYKEYYPLSSTEIWTELGPARGYLTKQFSEPQGKVKQMTACSQTGKTPLGSEIAAAKYAMSRQTAITGTIPTPSFRSP